MNWSRGLFRLWLVASVVWIGGVAAVTWLALPAGTFIAVATVDPNPPPPGFVPPFDPSKPYLVVPDGSTDLSKLSDDELVKLYNKALAAKGKPVTDPDILAQLNGTPRPRDQIRAAAFLAFMPPLFVLALGAASLWATRGFRAHRS